MSAVALAQPKVEEIEPPWFRDQSVNMRDCVADNLNNVWTIQTVKGDLRHENR